MNKTKFLTVRMKPDYMDKLRKLAEKEKRASSEMARVIIEERIEAKAQP